MRSEWRTDCRPAARLRAHRRRKCGTRDCTIKTRLFRSESLYFTAAEERYSRAPFLYVKGRIVRVVPLTVKPAGRAPGFTSGQEAAYRRLGLVRDEVASLRTGADA